MYIHFKALHLLLLSIYNISIVSGIQIYAGTSKLGGQRDTCVDIREFSCINNVCEPFAGSDHTRRGRNGDNPRGTCQPSEPCTEPTRGHCLENTISASGLHGMPSNKHFYCVSVLNFDKPAILWETNDCTGKKYFVPGAVEFGTWAKGAQANCVEIDPVSRVNAKPCLCPGQTEVFPPNGGSPSDVPELVGETYGLPASFDNSHTCD